MASEPEDVQATFCATLVDEWVRCGVRHAVVCPGSRSTPLALALSRVDGIEVHVQHDERSGGFLALGLALRSGVPAIVLTTSGTAAVELHPAMVEADLAGVPMLACTADRPPELIDVGAPQAIDQTHLYGRSVRWYHDPGTATEGAAGAWRALAARLVAESTGSDPGPVHLNLPFREPLVGRPGKLPPDRPRGKAWLSRSGGVELDSAAIGAVRDAAAGRRGVIVAGRGSGDGSDVAALATALGWPVLAAPQAGVWSGGRSQVVVGADSLLRIPALLDELRPEVVLRLGDPLASRAVNEALTRWCAPDDGAFDIVAARPGRWLDPDGTAAMIVTAPGLARSLAVALAGTQPVDGKWLDRWMRHSAAAASALREELPVSGAVTEPGVARDVVAALEGTDATLLVGSSMPIRDLEWYAAPAAPIEVHSNRGANGIDGVVSTAVGLALADRTKPTVLLTGDVGFLHDSNGLLGARHRRIHLVVVVVDNDGGGIFSFLPQAGSVDDATFEELYGTPHGLDLSALAAAYGVASRVVSDVRAELAGAIEAGGVHVLVARTDRATNVDVHRRLNEAVAEAVATST